MSKPNIVVKVIKEGKAQLQVPANVFYNPVQEFNRDLSVLIARTYLKRNVWHHKKEEKFIRARGGLKILDALSASGLRSIRYAKELGPSGEIVKKIVANDLSESAVEQIRKNVELNGVSDRVEVTLSDAAALLYKSTNFDDRFHIIDIDPFGTASPFLNAAIAGIGDGGLLMVTCTDAAVLCGNASESCFARYGSMSLKGEFCHEQALRILLRAIEANAATQGKYVKPLISLSIDFYIRIFVQVFSGQSETKMSASKLSLVYACKTCKTTETNPIGTCKLKDDKTRASSNNIAVKYNFKPSEVKHDSKCRICGGSYVLGGPIWSDAIHDREFLRLLIEELELPETKENFATFKRIQGMIHMCNEELPVPLFFSIDSIASALRVEMPKGRLIKSALVNAGYKVSGTHTNKNGFKTDAPSSVVWDILRQYVEVHKLTIKDPVGSAIVSQQRDKDYDFTYNPAIESEAEKKSMLRFQVNPTKGWGPQPRPAGAATKGANLQVAENTCPISNENDEGTCEGDAREQKRRKLSRSYDNIDQ